MAKSNSEKNDETIKARVQSKLDGWMNMFSGWGVQGVDRSISNTVSRSLLLTEEQNRNLYRTDFGAKVVNRPVDDMVKNWFDIKNDSDGDINNFLLNELNSQEAFKGGLTWGNVFGGSIVLMLIDDGATGDDALEQPLNESNIRSIQGLRVYDRWRATWESGTDLYNDPKDPKFGTPQFYRIAPLEPVPISQFRVHESRVLRFDGPLTDDRVLSENNWWNDSIYQKGYKALGQLEETYFSASSIIDDFIQSVLSIENLQNLIAAGQEDVVKKRMQILDLSKHTINTMLIDAKETYAKSASSVGGLNELMQEFQQRVAGTYGIPMTLFMGRSPGGMNSTGESDIRLYYDEIGNQQNLQMLKQAQRLVLLTMLSEEGPTNGKVIEDWKIEFNPLWEPTEKEIAETRKLHSETDSNHIMSGVLDPMEPRKTHFGGTEYSNDIFVEGELEPPEPPPEPQSNADDNEPTEIVGDPVSQAGVTSTVENHKHDYMISDKIRGTGKTSLGGSGETKHIHEIINFTVQPHHGPNGMSHNHNLPTSEPVEEIDPFRG